MTKSRLYVVLALLLGLLLGFLLFGRSETDTKPENSNHTHESSTVNKKWTCSMHPQIVKSTPGDCPICGMALIPLEMNSEGLTDVQFTLTKTAEALANIKTVTITGNATLNPELTLSGKIVVNEDETAIQPAHFNGRLEQLYVTSIGQTVRKGQLVASVYSPELINAQQELITAYKLKESQPELYKAVRGKFKNWMINDTQLKTIEQTGAVISKFNIYAHISGTVSEINVNEGDHIMDGKSIFKVANLNSVWAEFDAYENQISALQIGQELQVSTKAYPNQKVATTISFIDPVLNTNTRTVKVRAVLKNADAMYKPGMFVVGNIITPKLSNSSGIFVPASAVLWTGKRSVVYLKTEPNSSVFEMREVILGNKLADQYQVLEGLEIGDDIVVNGTFTVDAAAQLQGKSSMMNRLKTQYKQVEQSKAQRLEDNQESFKQLTGFKDEVNTILLAYIDVKNALVESDSVLATDKAKVMLKQLMNTSESDLKSSVLAQEFYNSIEGDLERSLNALIGSKTIEEIRFHFLEVSWAAKILVERFGAVQKVFVQFCPMANNNSGGYWLSLDQKIKNPYYGSKMLGCGENDKILE